MKKLVLILAVVVMCFAANAQVAKKETKKVAPKTEQTALKEHKCTPACKNGKHVYAHGEKGHKCTKDCKKENKKK